MPPRAAWRRPAPASPDASDSEPKSGRSPLSIRAGAYSRR